MPGVVIPPLNEPDAGRTFGPLIVQWYAPAGTAVASHVQLTDEPKPEPPATASPSASATSTRQASGPDRRPVKCTSPPGLPSTSGEYSFGSPVRETAAAMLGSNRYAAVPGQVV